MRIKLSLSFFLLAASFHLGARDITFLIDEIEVPLFSLDAALGYLLGATAFFATSCHFCAGNISLFINVVEVTFLPFDAHFHQFLCHVLNHPLSTFVIVFLSPDFHRIKNLP